ncbi:MAG: hypothetical protein KGL91_11630 [Xanthomonadaceae bacterium]|nr:hypothetical protein [Xanthomonadaceae bacterium]
MKTQLATLTLAVLGGLGAMGIPGSSQAGIVVTNLGAGAPPVTVGGHTVTPFALAPQTAISDYASVSIIPGNPGIGSLSIAPSAIKYTAVWTWGTDPWPGAYSGPIYFSGDATSSNTLTLPPGTTAFYFYVQNNWDENPMDTIVVTSDSGATSGPVLVNTGFWEPNVGANGFAVYSTAGETITNIKVETNNTSGFAIGNLGISSGPTCASSGYTGTQLLWCQKICESGLTGRDLDVWLQRWIRQFRQLPYCALPGGGAPRD